MHTYTVRSFLSLNTRVVRGACVTGVLVEDKHSDFFYGLESDLLGIRINTAICNYRYCCLADAKLY